MVDVVVAFITLLEHLKVDNQVVFVFLPMLEMDTKIVHKHIKYPSKTQPLSVN